MYISTYILTYTFVHTFSHIHLQTNSHRYCAFPHIITHTFPKTHPHTVQSYILAPFPREISANINKNSHRHFRLKEFIIKLTSHNSTTHRQLNSPQTGQYRILPWTHKHKHPQFLNKQNFHPATDLPNTAYSYRHISKHSHNCLKTQRAQMPQTGQYCIRPQTHKHSVLRLLNS